MFVTFITSFTIILVGWASMIAQYSLPWEVFYPIKVYGNEKLASVVAISPESETKLQLDLIKLRIEERNELISAWNMSQALDKQIMSQINYHSEILQEQLWKISERDLAQQIQSDLNSLMQAVEKQTSLFKDMFENKSLLSDK